MSRIAISLCLLAAVAAAAKYDTIRNGGFENGLKGWIPLNNSGNSKFDVEKKTVAEGKKALHWTKSGGQMDVLRLNLGAMPIGKKVTVSARIKASGVGNCWFKIFFYDAQGETIKQGNDLKQIRGSHDWKEISIKNKVPKGTKSGAVFILQTVAGEMWIDDVRLTGPGIAGAGEEVKAKPRPLPPSIKSYLDNRAIKVKTLDFDGSLSDLGRLKGMLRGVRIVQLGENTHGDGECFRAKARLVRYLHKEMGFTLLAFESGLFECELANELFGKGKVDDAINGSVFGIWRTSQTRPMFEYLASTRKSKNPLILTGFDTRGSGGLVQEYLLRLHEFLKPAGEIPTEAKLALQRIDNKLNQAEYKPDAEERQAGIAALQRLRTLFDSGRAVLAETHGERETVFQSRCLDNYIARERFEYSKNEPEKMGKHGSVNLRDLQMASNLRWLAEERYPEAKIITWGATFHLAHNLEKVSIGGDADYYKNTRAMGESVHEWLGEKVFTIGFVAYEGTGGILSTRFNIPEPREGSFEELMHRYGQPFLLVPLRPKNPFAEPMLAAPMAYGRNTLGPWPQVLDALFYIQEMTASSR